MGKKELFSSNKIKENGSSSKYGNFYKWVIIRITKSQLQMKRNGWYAYQLTKFEILKGTIKNKNCEC